MAELKKFLIRRLLTFIPTLIGVTLVVFVIANVIPADPARAWAGGEKARPEVIERIKEEYKLDEPWWVQYTFLMEKLFRNDIVSPRTHNKIWNDLIFGTAGRVAGAGTKYGRFFITLQLALMAFMYIVFIGIPLGILSALKKDSILDMFVRMLALIGVSTPVFWLGYLLIYLLYVRVRVIDIAGLPEPSQRITGIMVLDAFILGEYNIAWQIITRLALPAFVLGFIGIGVVARITRNSFLEAWNADYIEFGKARGLRRSRLMRHALKNALVPIVTVLGLQFGGLLGGAPITETVFGIPGLGRYMVEAIRNFDYPALIGGVLLFALIYMLANLIVDIAYAFIDPRVRY
ncbi:MAG TPA: ABC transporter permease [Desulfurococcaceae archaeon]|nr:ABC transporter permease [Desulfurococcaceae archaeon]